MLVGLIAGCGFLGACISLLGPVGTDGIQFSIEGHEAGFRLEPVYPPVEGVSATRMRKFITQAVEHVQGQLEEAYDAAFLEKHGLLPLPVACPFLHRP